MLRAFLARSPAGRYREPDVPASPESVCEESRDAAKQAWCRYWMERSPELQRVLAVWRDARNGWIIAEAGVARISCESQTRCYSTLSSLTATAN